MDIKELKQAIEHKTLSKFLLVLKWSDNPFLANQYANAIVNNFGFRKIYINSLDEMDSNDIFDTDVNTLYVYDVEKLESNIDPQTKNLIVICKDVPVTLSVDYIEMPKIVNWQIDDFIQMRLPKVSREKIEWLCNICKYDIYRIDQECKKLEIFTPEEQEIVFDILNMDNAYSDLTSLTIFNYMSALMKRDFSAINEMISSINEVDIEGTGLITLLHKQIKNIIDVQMNPKATAESLGMTPKQFGAIKYSVGRYTDKQLIRMFDFINELDYRLKNGDLMFKADNRENNAKLVDYITTTFLIIGTKSA